LQVSRGIWPRWKNRRVRRPRSIVLVLAFAAGLAVPVVALSETPSGSGTTSSATATTQASGQALFRDTLLGDARTSSAVRRLLQSGAGFVDPASQFGDVTGDGKSDAVVRVATGGAAGAIAVYVLSTDGVKGDAPKLRVVYRTQQLYRATTRIENGGVTIIVARYARGDEPCCPSKQILRTYAWDAEALTMHRTSSTEISGPGAPAPPQR
jgi:hypothetical protein